MTLNKYQYTLRNIWELLFETYKYKYSLMSL